MTIRLLGDTTLRPHAYATLSRILALYQEGALEDWYGDDDSPIQGEDDDVLGALDELYDHLGEDGERLLDQIDLHDTGRLTLDGDAHESWTYDSAETAATWLSQFVHWPVVLEVYQGVDGRRAWIVRDTEPDPVPLRLAWIDPRDGQVWQDVTNLYS